MSAVMSRAARATWEAIRTRYEAGESVPSAARRMAEEALGETFVRRGQAKRPDVADRAAGDDSFDDDDGMVLL